MTSDKKHPQVEFMVEGGSGREQYHKTFAAAAEDALSRAITSGKAALDVLVYTADGAYWCGGDDAVVMYEEDPEASAFERFEIKVNNAGMIP